MLSSLQEEREGEGREKEGREKEVREGEGSEGGRLPLFLRELHNLCLHIMLFVC